MPLFLSFPLITVADFGISAIAGCFLVNVFSSNTRDGSLEAAMTAIFVFGPLGAIGAAIWAPLARRTAK
jgi:hypothetical protein